MLYNRMVRDLGRINIRHLFIWLTKNLFFAFSIFMILVTPLQSMSGEVNLLDSKYSYFSDYSESKNLPTIPLTQKHTSEKNEKEGESETEESERFEKEFEEVWAIHTLKNNNLSLSYGTKALTHLQRFTQDGFISKLFKPPTLS